MAERYESEEHETELRGKLMKRLAVAGVMVALLLGVLAFFDHLAAPPEPSAPVFTKPVPVPPKKEVTQPVRPNPDLAEAPKTEAPKEEGKPASAAPPAEPPPKPEVAAQPAPALPAENKASGKIQPQRAVPSATEPTPARNVPRPAPEASSAPVSPGSPATPASPATPQPVQPPQPAATTPPPVATSQPVSIAPPPLARLLSGYVVQAGVFNNARTAEELHAKLALNGIPSTLEARVQAGPFKTRAEADAAREKMKALGISGILIPPAGARR